MIKKIKEIEPQIGDFCFVAENATIIGDVEIGKGTSIWYGAVLRGDINKIKIGEFSNIQDNCVCHLSNVHGTIIGNRVTVGHNAILHGCSIEDNCLIGMGAVILDGAVIGKNSIIGANSFVGHDKKIPEGVMAFGSPVQIIRPLTEEELMELVNIAQRNFQHAIENQNSVEIE